MTPSPCTATLACLPLLALLAPLPTRAAEPAATPQTVVITGTRGDAGLAALPLSADVLDSNALQAGQPKVNLSESLQRVPGIVAQNRQNYAQDLQISSRGFGARSTFGVRGLRFLVDGIPATLPDGQAQVSHIDLGSAGRLEVLRGPFSALYGNAAGGVVAVFTEEADEGQTLSAEVAGGSDRQRRHGVKAMGATNGLHYTLSASHFSTAGSREHSAAARDNQNARLRIAVDEHSQLVLVANAVQMPEVQDPLGLTRAQFAADPQQADSAALRFNTRKSVEQMQLGLGYERQIGPDDRLALQLYGGERSTVQFQSIPSSAQQAPTSPGGVIDLGRNYSGADLRWTHSGALAQQPWRLAAGLAFDRVNEQRRGYQNFVGSTLGVVGAPRRDETNRADSLDPYAQLEWEPSARWLLLAGLRASRVTVRSVDAYIVPGNGDDSGSVRYRAVSPALGATFKATPALHLYAAYGQGFETPTLAELAYRSTDGSDTGLNLGLRAAHSRHMEAGAKARWSDTVSARLALFDVRTLDELAVQANSGGRSVFQNAGRTRRQGAEALVEGRWANGLGALLSVSTLRARYADSFCSGPCDTGLVAAGNRLPGAPGRTAYAEVSWRHAPSGASMALEARGVGRVMVNDLNTDAAAGYAVLNLRTGIERTLGPWRLQAYVRADNLADKRYAGSVIVNEGNQRYFEPAPGRSLMLGAGAAYHW
ncbi:TonB-dependent receptor family protein [Ideonella sp. BN130291]|uniref:TonB-dependent receptor family protein n=1 Tax=Ideonella sp. BN130291 TaxID=3112940 RepID=UPI002E25CC01|nr:TonB-dependent receptor [Ideonella sp. BN130291]